MLVIAGRCSYLPGANNLGLIAAGDGTAIVVDTGIDKDAARSLRKAIDVAGLRLRAIISTHHHADHIGGNEFLLRNIPGVEVFAPALEAPLISNPLLEPIYLSLGAAPPAALQTKWLLSKGSPVHHTLAAGAPALPGAPLEVVPLPGHSIGQAGVALDGVCFAADGFFGPAVLARHGIPYAHDIAAQLASFDTLAARDEAFFLPGHGDLATRAELPALLDINRAAVLRGSEAVLAAIAEPADLATVGVRAAQQLGLTLGGLPQYAIFLSAVSAHLTYLAAQGRASLALVDNRALWNQT